MQNDLLKFEIWVAKNGMDLQLSKCYLLNFKPQTLSIKLYGETLTSPSIVKDLGILISSNLSLHDPLNKKLSKTNSVFWMVRRNILNNLDWKSRLCLYKSLILPIVTYGNMCWVLSRSECRLVEGFQKRVTKWIFNYEDADYFTRLSTANLLPVPMFLQLLDLLHLSSICSGAYDCDYTPFINYRDTEKQRCHSDLFLLKSLNYCKSRDSFFFRHRGEAVLRKHLRRKLRTFEETQISNIIRRAKGKRTLLLKFHQFYSAKKSRRDTHKSRKQFENPSFSTVNL